MTLASDLFDGVNALRVANGETELDPDGVLDQAGDLRSQDMVDNDYFSHYPPSGRTVFVILKEELDYEYDLAGENIASNNAADVDSVQMVLDAFMASPQQKSTLLDNRYERMGVGFARNGALKYYTVVFSDPATSNDISHTDDNVNFDAVASLDNANQLIWEGLPGVYMAAADQGLYLTIDNGESWGPLRPNPNFEGSWPAGAIANQASFNVGPRLCDPNFSEDEEDFGLWGDAMFPENAGPEGRFGLVNGRTYLITLSWSNSWQAWYEPRVDFPADFILGGVDVDITPLGAVFKRATAFLPDNDPTHFGRSMTATYIVVPLSDDASLDFSVLPLQPRPEYYGGPFPCFKFGAWTNINGGVVDSDVQLWYDPAGTELSGDTLTTLWGTPENASTNTAWTVTLSLSSTGTQRVLTFGGSGGYSSFIAGHPGFTPPELTNGASGGVADEGWHLIGDLTDWTIADPDVTAYSPETITYGWWIRPVAIVVQP